MYPGEHVHMRIAELMVLHRADDREGPTEATLHGDTPSIQPAPGRLNRVRRVRVGRASVWVEGQRTEVVPRTERLEPVRTGVPATDDRAARARQDGRTAVSGAFHRRGSSFDRERQPAGVRSFADRHTGGQEAPV